MNDFNKYFKASVVDLTPYSSARDEYQGNEGIFLDANENALDFAYNRYPDPYQTKLKEMIGAWRQMDSKSIFLGNGSDEIIDLLIRSTCTSGRDRILSLDPSYGMYRVSSSINEIPLDLLEMNDDLTVNSSLLDKIDERYRLIFICSPNNPNGGIIDPKIIEEVLERSSGLVVIDEAYIDFSDSGSWLERLAEYDNLVVMQTFSKSLAAAGIRLGMAFMNPALVTILNKIKPPYNISIPNQVAAIDRLKNMAEVERAIQSIKEERESVREALEKLSIVKNIYPSSANFLLVKFLEARFIFEQLRSRKIIVRDRSKEKHCQGCIRITIGTKKENQALLNALKEIEKQITIAL